MFRLAPAVSCQAADSLKSTSRGEPFTIHVISEGSREISLVAGTKLPIPIITSLSSLLSLTLLPTGLGDREFLSIPGTEMSA